MRTAAVVFDGLLVAFTCFVLVTDGASREVPYIVFGFLLLAVPTLSAALLVHRGGHRSGSASDASPAMRRASHIAVLCNVWLLGTACWALYDQYPHPDEQGFVAYVTVVLLTPILSIVALLTSSKRGLGRQSGVA